MAKITSIELFKVPPRWLFLKVSTDEGICGWGEPLIEGRANTVKAAVLELEEYLIGKDPQQIEDLWQVLYRGGFYRGGPILMSAISGIEQALWDIHGRMLGVPVYKLMGGSVRNKMRVYSWIGGDRPSDVATAAREKLDAGMTAVKMNGTEEMDWIDRYEKIDEVIERVQAIKDATDGKLDIAVDLHGRVHKSMARVLMKELEPYRLMFVEEPVLVENREAFAELRRHTCIPIATGERNYTRWDFKQMLQDGAVDILQPDVSHAGGIWELRKIAAMAEAYDVAVAPHCPLGPIALASCLQVDFCTVNAAIQEQSLNIHYNAEADILDYLKDPTVFRYEDGYAYLLEKPGLGIEVDEDVVRKKTDESLNWKNPVWRQADGCIAEW